jgi:glyoxylase-like metal-dependent hydrolase (beta-lactamase superfamily II)
MSATLMRTVADSATVHTYTAPEHGWRVNSHLIELPSQLILVDAQLTIGYAQEVRSIAEGLGKPITRVYISHAHPDHFVGASVFDAPTYALASQRELINRCGDIRIERGYRYTPGHEDAGEVHARPVDEVVEPGNEEIDGVRFEFRAPVEAETTEQLAIGLPAQRILLAQDVLYHGVHLFIGEHAFDTWEKAIDSLSALPYDILLPGHGMPGDRSLYARNREYLDVARTAYAAATGPADLNRRLEAAYPTFGGKAMQGLQNFYLFPDR